MTFSCQSNYPDLQDIQDVRNSNFNIEELKGIQHDIAVNIMTSHFGGYNKGESSTRSNNQFSISPYILNGDTALYIAQYEDGWEIYSSNYASNMILFSSEEGIFNIDDPNMPDQLRFLINESASDVSEISKQDLNYIDPSWGGIALSEEDILQGNITVLNDDYSRTPVSSSSVPPGHWILIKSEEIDRYTYTSPKLTSTSWGQNQPWNSYAKWVLNPTTKTLEQTPAGCATVAISQYLYFTHFKNGVPANSVCGATLKSDKTDYAFFGNDSFIWNRMAKSRSVPGTNETALLIGQTGRRLCSEYNLNGTSTTDKNCLNVLNSIYGNIFHIESFYSHYVENAIDNGYPIIAGANTNKTSMGNTIEKTGHLFLIDRYRKTKVKYKYTYALVRDPLPPGTVDKWISDITDINGNIIEYAYTNEVISESTATLDISMNWGWDGNYDNIFYKPTKDWSAGGYDFNLNHRLFVRDN